MGPSPAPPVDPGRPITRWQIVAFILGVSYDTVWRRRREFRDRDPSGRCTGRAHFRDADEVWKWWRSLEDKPVPKPAPPKPKGRAHVLPGPLDVSAKLERFRRKRES